MSRVPAHHFDNLYPTMRSSDLARTFDYFRNIPERGVEAECVVSARKIFVDGFRHADDRDSSFRQYGCHTERVFTAANDERIQIQMLDVLDHFMRAILCFTFCVYLFERISARRAEIGATITVPTPHRFAIERQHVG